MRDNRFKLMVLAASASLALLAPLADSHAAGLGRLTVFSTLGQPLNAEIELLSVQRNETITARLASQDVYQQANAQFNNALTGARVTVEKRSNGQLYLKATTPRAISEPFVELLIEINSENGRTVRQYTALLDPPGYGRAAAEIPPPRVETAPETRTAAPAVAPLSPSAPSAPAPSAAISAPPPAAGPAAAPVRRSRAAAPRSEAPAAPSRAANPRQYGPIKPGETLGRIARVVKPEGVSLEQTLVGLYRENPEAFIRQNMNLVKSGRILTVPEANELAAVSQPEARKEIRLQTADFNSFRDRLAGRATPVAESGGVTSGRIGTRVADSGSEGPQDTVRLSRGDAKGKAGAAGERVRALEEEAIARDKALTEANARIAQLEAIIKDSQRAAELKAGAPKGAEQGVATSGTAAPPLAAPLPTPPGKAPDTPLLTTDNILAPPGTKPVDTPPGAPDIVAEAPQTPEPKPEVAPKAKKPPEPVLAPEVDVVDTLMSEPLYLAAGAAVLLGGVGLVLARRRRTTERATTLDTDDGLVKIPPSTGGTSPAKDALPSEPTEPKLGTQALAPAPAPVPASTSTTPPAKTAAPDTKPSTSPSKPAAAPVEARKLDTAAPGAAKPASGTTPRPAGAPADDNDLDFNVGNPRPTSAAGAAAGTLAGATAGLAAQAGRSAATAAGSGSASGAAPASSSDAKRAEPPAAASGVAPAAIPSAGQPVSAPTVPPTPPGAFPRVIEPVAETPKPVVPPPVEVASETPPSKPPANPALNTPLEFDAPKKTEAPASRATEVLKAAQAQRDKDVKPLEMTPPEKAAEAKPLDPKAAESKTGGAMAPDAKAQDQKPAASKPPEPLMPDFALDAGGLTLPESKSPEKAPDQKSTDTAKDSNLLDFDLEPLPPISSPMGMDTVSSEPPAAMDFKLDLADLDIGGTANRNATPAPTPAHDEHWYDVQQKFDLAKAYEEMGDKSGAREILQEVVREGDTGQQEQARKLLGSLS